MLKNIFTFEEFTNLQKQIEEEVKKLDLENQRKSKEIISKIAYMTQKLDPHVVALLVVHVGLVLQDYANSQGLANA